VKLATHLHNVKIMNERISTYTPVICRHCADIEKTLCIVLRSRTPKRTGNSACNEWKEKETWERLGVAIRLWLLYMKTVVTELV